MIKIGVIADDFTGATDIASFLVENGLPTVQINGVPTGCRKQSTHW
ncbi:paral putative tRNA synthase [Escherichia coli]|nr:paral putative tRNA synthase [Escherichia coli]